MQGVFRRELRGGRLFCCVPRLSWDRVSGGVNSHILSNCIILLSVLTGWVIFHRSVLVIKALLPHRDPPDVCDLFAIGLGIWQQNFSKARLSGGPMIDTAAVFSHGVMSCSRTSAWTHTCALTSPTLGFKHLNFPNDEVQNKDLTLKLQQLFRLLSACCGFSGFN